MTSSRPFRQPVNGPAQAGWPLCDYLAAPIQIDRDHLAGSPVSEPEPALMPARRFHISKAIQQHTAGLRYRVSGL